MARSHKKSHRKSRSHKKSHRKSRSPKKSKSRRSRTYRLTKKQFHSLKLDECRSRRLKKNCISDPNCSWSRTKRHCYKGKRSVYYGPALPSM